MYLDVKILENIRKVIEFLCFYLSYVKQYFLKVASSTIMAHISANRSPFELILTALEIHDS